MKNRFPPEIVASVLAGLTAFIGGNALNLPPWAIFISWAGTFLLGGPSLDTAKRLWRTMPVGSAYALIIVLLDQHFGTMFGTSTLAKDAALGVFILVMNSCLMFTGRISYFALVPGMFFGFASFFATFFGGFGFAAGNIWAAWVSVVAMNFLGPVFAYLNVRLSAPHAPTVETPEAETTEARSMNEPMRSSEQTGGTASDPTTG